MARHLRIIKGGQWQPEDHQHGETELFLPYSIGELKVGKTVFHGVRFNWYCVDRQEPIGRYQDLIANYSKLEEKQRLFLEAETNRCLLADEVDELRWYVRHRYTLDVVAESVQLPIRERLHLHGGYPNDIYQFLQLTENTGYSLLFKVWGYYSTRHCLTSSSVESGVEFLLKALKWLPLRVSVGKEDLEQVVKRLYREEGMFVERSSEEVQSS